MENFVMYNPTNLQFGKGAIGGLSAGISQLGKKVLLVYGKGSIQKNGIYYLVINQLKKAGCEVFEYGGIRPNPIMEDVDAAAALCRKHEITAIVAVGGGSVIDSAKYISVTVPVRHSVWDFLENKAKPKSGLPLITVLTVSATGSEMNGFAVIQNNKTRQKLGYFCPFFFPRYSFLDPEFTYSVPKNYTAYGLVDTMSHCLEGYFGKGESPLTDKFTLSVMREVMESGPKLLENLQDYDLRARMMFASTSALNGLVIAGKVGGDWGAHSIGHTLSVLYDVPHGATLSVVYPAWFKHLLDRLYKKMSFIGENLFNTTNVAETIYEFEAFFKKIGCPVRLADMNIGKDKKEEIIKNLMVNKANGNNFILTEEDLNAIVEMMM
jgi:alcohol dehydrogenase YqhD (iron-dependent ADH family)